MNLIRAVLLALLVLPLPASAYTSGDWVVDISGNMSEAYTTSDSGATFGYICLKSSSTCVYYLNTPTLCTDDLVIPMLGNSDGGSFTVLGTCQNMDAQGNSKLHVLVLSPYTDVEKGIAGGRTVGFAFPLVEGQFKVYRFSLNGCKEALSAVENAAAKATGDQTL